MYTSDAVDFISNYEAGNITDELELAAGFQKLIDSGLCWQLQGSYGRMAQGFIDAGLCHPPQRNNPRCYGGQCE